MPSPLNYFIKKRHKINIQNGRHFDAISMLNAVISKTSLVREIYFLNNDYTFYEQKYPLTYISSRLDHNFLKKHNIT